ncbi:MAG: hypothetical protein V4543_08985 [Bacteroidota bacterium]
MKKLIAVCAIAALSATFSCGRVKPNMTAEPGAHAGVDMENRIGGHPDQGLAVDTSDNKWDKHYKVNVGEAPAAKAEGEHAAPATADTAAAPKEEAKAAEKPAHEDKAEKGHEAGHDKH